MISDLDKKIVSYFQGDIPLTLTPYEDLAREIGITEEELLDRLAALETKGVLRRVGALLAHYRAGYSSNGMCAWRVPLDRVEEAGRIMASFPQASHVYQRPVYSDWPFNLFSMLHGTNREEVEGVAREMSKRTGISDYTILYSTREFKKAGMRYY